MHFGKRKIKKKKLETFEEEYQIEVNQQISKEMKSKQLQSLVAEQMLLIEQLKNQYGQSKKEYQLLTKYLQDIETLEQLNTAQKEKVTGIATQIVNLTKQQDETIQSEQKISDAQFSMMEQMEDEIPRAIKQLQENEENELKIRRDLDALEGEKANWQFEKSALSRENKWIRNISILSFITILVSMSVFLVLAIGLKIDIQLPILIISAIGFLAAIILTIKKQQNQTNKQQAEICLNKAITIQNKIKLKYVNIANAVDYEHEKYHVNHAQQFSYEWECYLAAKKEQEKKIQMNEDLNYFYQSLLRELKAFSLYDTRIWQNRVNALADPREMVEMKHGLIVRRQKVRSRMESQIDNIDLKSKEVEILLKNDQI